MALMLVGAAVSCSKNEVKDTTPGQLAQTSQQGQNNYGATRALDISDPAALEFSDNQLVAAYFDWHLFTLQVRKVIDEPVAVTPPFKREPAELFVYDVRTVPGVVQRGLMPVTSSTGDAGMPMLWTAIKIRFNPGFTPQQFYSSDQIHSATLGAHPSITLISSGAVYEGRLFDLVKTSGRPAPGM